MINCLSYFSGAEIDEEINGFDAPKGSEELFVESSRTSLLPILLEQIENENIDTYACAKETYNKTLSNNSSNHQNSQSKGILMKAKQITDLQSQTSLEFSTD